MIALKLEVGYSTADRAAVVAFARRHGIDGGFYGAIRELARRGLAVHVGFLETAAATLPEEDAEQEWEALIVQPDAYLALPLRGDSAAMAKALGLSRRFITLLDLFAAIGAIDTANPDGGARWLWETLLGTEYEAERSGLSWVEIELPSPWF